VAAPSKAWVCGRSLARIAGSNPAGAWISVYCECCELSGRSLCVGLIACPEESHECCVTECDFEASIMKRPLPSGGCRATGKNIYAEFLLM
jgi:hypothetical protein